MRKEYFLGPPLVTFAWIVAIAVIASGAVVAISWRRGADRTAIIDRLKAVGLTTAVGTVAVLTLQPGPGGVGSALPPIPNPVSGVDRLDLLQNVLLYLPVGFLAALVWSKSELIVARATVFAFLRVLLHRICPVDTANQSFRSDPRSDTQYLGWVSRCNGWYRRHAVRAPAGCEAVQPNRWPALRARGASCDGIHIRHKPPCHPAPIATSPLRSLRMPRGIRPWSDGRRCPTMDGTA